MVKVGPFIYIGGTTAVQPDGTVYGEGNAYAQAKYIFEKLVKLLQKAGSKKEEVIRVKGYATDMKYAQEISKAFSEIFLEIKPLFTIVGTPMLNRPSQLIELEMDAIIGSTLEYIS